MASGGQNYVSRLPLTPLTGDHEGEYTCTAQYTLNGAMYSASDIHTVGELFSPNTLPSSYVTSVVLEMSVEVKGSGRGRVGTVYTLTCTVTLTHRVRDSSVSIQWQGPSTDDQPTVDSTDNGVITRQLSLDPLTLAHGGNYTCTAVYRVNGEDIITNSDSETLTIPGMNHLSVHAIFLLIL